MDVIITHVNADFDAFASMVAAKKLYPDAVVAFPGSQEKNLRDFFMESTLYILSIERAKDIDLGKVRRLILVDTRQKHRIGRFAELVGRKDLEIHIYDHHPDSDDDVHGTFEHVEELGATVTLLIRLIREKGIEINSEEATVLALGIYEDTGSFMFSSTTKEDLETAGWLVENGANLNIISNMMENELSRDQIEVLHELIEEAEIVNISGLEIVVTTAGAEGYVGDLAVLVHRYRDMENMDAIFAIVRMEDRIHLIARSSTEEVNAGEIAAEFGGGGHATAASATIRNFTLYEAKDRVIQLLKERVRPKQLAGEIMSKPVITIDRESDIAEAGDILSRYQISSVPVMRDDTVVGILHRSAVEKARRHGLGNEPVHEYMNPGMMFVTPEEPIRQVLQLTVEGRHRLVPVIDQGHLVGVISRSDLLEHMKFPRQSDSAGPDEYPGGRARQKSVRKLMEERLPTPVMTIIRKAGEIAAARGEEAYLVGGAVRDLLLRIRNLDIDLVIEGEGIPFAAELASEFPGVSIRTHAKFGTAALLFEEDFKIDVATARYEYYARPGALPTVEMSSIKRDLYRRDFTINTLAVSINPKTFGKLIDFFGGSKDIKEKNIRVLHNLAFVEDPTRILRAIRFGSRYEFQISKHTLKLIKAALRMRVFDKVEGKRLLNELFHIVNEKNPMSGLALLTNYGILSALHPALSFSAKTKELIEAVAGVLSWWKYLFLKDKMDSWQVFFFALTDAANDEEFEDVLRRFSVTPNHAGKIMSDRIVIKHVLSLMARGLVERPSEIARALRPLSIESLLFTMAKTVRDRSRMAIADYITSLRYVKPILTGRDLTNMGYPPGPMFHRILSDLKNARLDGILITADDEREFVMRSYILNSVDSAQMTS
jgi:tRNA nucleotidyltransferase (CCA-adding enzyme)